MIERNYGSGGGNGSDPGVNLVREQGNSGQTEVQRPSPHCSRLLPAACGAVYRSDPPLNPLLGGDFS